MIKRGQIYHVDLNPVRGREQRGRRPVLVVSDDAINQQPLVVTVVVGTASSNVTHDYPTNVRIPASETGLAKDTVFLCFQIRSLDPGRFASSNPAGVLSASRMLEIDRALKLVLSLR